MKNSEIKNVSMKKNILENSLYYNEDLNLYSYEKDLESKQFLKNNNKHKNYDLFPINDSFENDNIHKNYTKNDIANNLIAYKNNNKIENFTNARSNNIFFEKENQNEFSQAVNGNENDNNYYHHNNSNDLRKPLLSSIKNNTKNTLNFDNINISESKNIFSNHSKNKENKIMEPNNTFNNLSNQKISNAFVLEYEKNVINCNSVCVNTCSKTNFINLLSYENEEIFNDENLHNSRKNPNEFISSSKSYLFLFTTVIFAAFHIAFYRKVYDISDFYYYENKQETKLILDESNNNGKNFSLESFLNISKFLCEINIFTWRFQIICFMLILYKCISNYLIQNNYKESLEGRITVLEDVKGGDFFKYKNPEKKLHLIYLNLKEIISIENLKNMSVICLSIFLLFFSSLFIPISMCLAVQYLTILLKSFLSLGLNFEIKSNKLFRIIIYMLTLLGLIMSLSNNFYYYSKNNNSGNVYINIYEMNISKKFSDNNTLRLLDTEIQDHNDEEIKTRPENNNNHENKKNLSNTKENSTYEYKKLTLLINFIGISLSILSGLINVFFCDDIHKIYLNKNSAFEYLIILNFNSTAIMTFLNFNLNAYFGNPFYSINWVIQNENGLNVYIFLLGLIGFLNAMLTQFSAVYLNNAYLKFVKILEIPLADTIAISILSVYKYTNEINYHIGLINFLIVIVFLEFSDFFIKKITNRKYDF